MQTNGFRLRVDERLVDVGRDEHAGCVELDACSRERRGAVVQAATGLQRLLSRKPVVKFSLTDASRQGNLDA
jgi:hypothetical protein